MSFAVNHVDLSAVKPRHSAGLCLAFALLLSVASATRAADSQAWETIRGKHFIVYYQGSKSFAKKVAREAERHYERISRELGFTKRDRFWLWDDRVKLYIHPDRASFMRSTGAPAWAAGKASHEGNEIITYETSPTFFAQVLPHEMTHLIFRDFIGFKGDKVPMWLNEGIAQWEEVDRRGRVRRNAVRMYRRGRLVPLAELTRRDVRRVKDAPAAFLFYTQSASLVGYLIEEHGSARFRTLCGHLRDGKSLEDALRFTYPERLRTIDHLEKAWRKHIAEAVR